MKIFLLVTLIFIFSSCGNPRKRAQRTTASTNDVLVSSGSCACTNEYKPVCSNDKITFGNSCQARCQGKTSYTNGRCQVSSGPTPTPSATSPTTGNTSPTVKPPTPSGCLCARNYDPVCGSDGVTYPNKCGADCESISSTKGVCSTQKSCECRMIDYAPKVCGNDRKTYLNSCKATCAGVSTYTTGECSVAPTNPSPQNCVCNQVYNPVCGSDKRTYTNACLAKCGKVSFKSGPCSGSPYPGKHLMCYCSRTYSPVCGADGETYGNICKAVCAGFSYKYGRCSTEKTLPPKIYY